MARFQFRLQKGRCRWTRSLTFRRVTGLFPKPTLFDRDFWVLFFSLWEIKNRVLVSTIYYWFLIDFNSACRLYKAVPVARRFDFNPPTSTFLSPLRTIPTSFSNTFISTMDKIETPKEEPKEEPQNRYKPTIVEEYQMKWDQMLQDTARQIDQIRGTFLFWHGCRRGKLTASIENELARMANNKNNDDDDDDQRQRRWSCGIYWEPSFWCLLFRVLFFVCFFFFSLRMMRAWMGSERVFFFGYILYLEASVIRFTTWKAIYKATCRRTHFPYISPLTQLHAM